MIIGQIKGSSWAWSPGKKKSSPLEHKARNNDNTIIKHIKQCPRHVMLLTERVGMGGSLEQEQESR